MKIQLMRSRAVTLLTAVLALAAGLYSPASAADSYPERHITLVVPVAAGGAMDVVARKIAEQLSRRLGQSVVVENKAGAGGGIGAASVARARPDGYTLLMGNIGPNAINVSLYKKLPYDNEKDFSPVGLIARLPHLLVLNPQVPASSVSELVALAKAKPGSVTFATSGAGQSIHVAAELFKRTAGVDMLIVPYPGGAPAMRDVLAGVASMTFDPVGTSLPLVRSGKLRAIAVSSGRRLALVPDIPTVAESGMPGFDVSAWFGLIAPMGTPQAVVGRLNQELNNVLRDPEMVVWFTNMGAETSPGSPADFAAFIRAETEKWRKVIASAGIQLE